MPRRKLPDFSEEKKRWMRGFHFVAGVDEVGRGAWAGPIVVASVVFESMGDARRGPRSSARSKPARTSERGVARQDPSQISKTGINDSKQIRPRQREKLADFIKDNALAWGIGEVGAAEINRLGMARATKQAFRKAIKQLSNKTIKPDFLLIDAFFIPYVRGLRRKRQKAIIDGDQKSISIAAASILAKVWRDKLMRKLARKYKVYGWGKNKGYGTRQHQSAIKKYGITRLHRKAFVETWERKKGY